MKKSITGVVALLAGAFVAHSQGTVSFGNYGVLAPYIYVSLGSTKLGGSATGTGVAANDAGAGSEWTVALYGNSGSGDAASTLVQLQTAASTPVTATMEVNNPTTDTTAGTWYSTAIANVPGTTLAGQAATVQVYAWYNDNGTYTTYAAAKAAGVPTGFSATANTVTGGPNTTGPASVATPLPSSIGSFTVAGGTTTPEPSTIALGIMGASAFLLRLRKKQ